MHRVFDFAIASTALFLLAPVLLCIAAAIGCLDRAPALFFQKRIGKDGKAFTMVKFRSLTPDGTPTRMGAVLRRYSLDELPEFWNVLRGDMALVGPRPMIEADQPKLPVIRALRQQIRPGITGWAQINGRNALSFEQTFRLDLWYRRNRSLWLDLYIVFATVPCVLSGRGACALAPTSRPKVAQARKPANATT
ncbi:MAG: sugar transferase [Pseudomonadota bacterium]